jgi:60 kDa SS-A/Ro ribonucleoprotein
MKGHFDPDALPPVIEAAHKAHETRDVREWVRLIERNRSLSWEMLPSEALAKAEVWVALIDNGNLPLGALLRNLSRLTRLGVIAPMSTYNAWIAALLTDKTAILKARIHPIQVLLALKTYALGHSIQGTSRWLPVPQVTDALNEMFYLAFGNVVPSGKRTLICLDVSSSMNNTVSGYAFKAREISAAMALITMKTEPQYAAMAFSHQFVPLGISPAQRLDDVVNSISNLPFGRTDCALPMAWAQYNNLAVDTFQVWTDNETWYGPNGHPHEALKSYRRATGINARLQVAAITPTQFSIADPLDPGQLDVSGFDAAVPKLMADHARGDI